MGNCRSYDGVTHDKYAGPSDVQKSSPHMMVHDGSILGLSYWNEALAIASDNKEISVHSLPTLLSDTDYLGSYMKGHEKAVNRLSFHLQTGKLWSASRDLSIRMWDPLTTENIVTIKDAHALNISSVLCPPAIKETVFSGSRDYFVKGWDIESSKCHFEFHTPRNIVTALTSKVDDANLIYQGSEDLCVRVWDIREKSTIPAVHITGYIYFPLCMHIQNDGNTLATGCKGFNSVGCGVTLWDVRNTAKPLNEFKGHSQDVTGCQFHPSNGRWLASVSKDGSVIIWDIHDSVCVGEYQFPKKWISSLTLGDCSNKNGEVSLEVIVGSLDGSISVLNFTKSEGLKLSFESKGMDQPVNEIS